LPWHEAVSASVATGRSGVNIALNSRMSLAKPHSFAINPSFLGVTYRNMNYDLIEVNGVNIPSVLQEI
jgi:hypothetical protein